jgi:hypothetical protein
MRRTPARSAAAGRRVAVLASVALAACGGDADAGEGAFTVRDSAGVRIAESAAPAWRAGRGWRIGDAPEVEVGVAEGAPAHQFGRITGSTRLSNGVLVVADAGAGQVRAFTPDGRHLWTLGRKGGGPGEFEGMGRVVRTRGDTVAVWDSRHRRVTFVAPDGSLAGEAPFRPEGFGTLVGGLANGDLLFTVPSRAGMPPSGLQRDTTDLIRWSGIDAWETVGRVPGAERYVKTEQVGRGLSVNVISRPFGRTGSLAAVAEGFYVGGGDDYEIVRHAPDGSVQLSIRRPVPNRPVTPADMDRHREQQLAATRDPARRSEFDAMLRSISAPETMPAYAEIRADAEGSLWVRETADGTDGPAAWSVFTAEGRLLGTVALPERFRVTEIGTDYVLGTWRDDLDVQYVRLYRLVKP